MRRFRPFVAVLLLLPFVGTGVSSLAALHLMAHGNHHVTLETSDGRVAIVLEHHADDHHHDHDDHTPAPTHSHATDDDHVVTIASSFGTSVAPSRYTPEDGGPVAPLSFAAISPLLDNRFSVRPARSRVGPPPPARSTILRI